MRKSWIVLFAAVFIFLNGFQLNAEAAAGDAKNCQSNSVFAQYHCAKSPATSGQKQQDPKQPQLTSTTASGTAGMFVRVFLVLAVVIGLIYFLLRFVNAKTKSFADGKAIQNIGGTSVGSNRSVQMIKVGDRILVVGVGEDVSLLKEIDNADEVSSLLEVNQREDAIDQSFTKLKGWLSKNKAGKSIGQGKTSFQKMLEGRLKQMAQERKKAFDELKKKGFGE